MPPRTGPLKGARVGVVARTANLARTLAQELSITRPVLVGVRSRATRMPALAVLLVDDSAWPLTEELEAALLPCLERHKGYVLHVKRYNP